MSQEPTDISLDALFRALERHYALHAAPIFRENGIPEPPRLPDPALPGTGAVSSSTNER
jgi:hypothetical protein